MEEIYQDAFNIAYRVQTLQGGLRTFRRHWPELSREDSLEIFSKVFPRAQRVSYFENAGAGQFISRERLGCGPSGNVIFATYQVAFIDEDGNQHQQYFHALAPIEPRVGTTRNELENQVLIQLQDRYFPDRQVTDLWKTITAAKMTQVKCLTGGD